MLYATDLNGKPRIYSRHVDIGAVESQSGGFMLQVCQRIGLSQPIPGVFAAFAADCAGGKDENPTREARSPHEGKQNPHKGRRLGPQGEAARPTRGENGILCV